MKLKRDKDLGIHKSCDFDPLANNFRINADNTHSTNLHDINLKISKGEYIGIIGDKGSRKSFLIAVFF